MEEIEDFEEQVPLLRTHLYQSRRTHSDYSRRWDPSKGSFWIHAAAGSFAGLAEHALVFPLDTVRTHAQTAGIRQEELLVQVRTQGLARLFRGVAAVATASVPAHAAYFSIYESSKEALGVNTPGHHPLAAAATGIMATTAHDAVMTPMDVVKQRMQLGFYSGMVNCIQTICRTEGASALFLSFPTTLMMNVPYASVMVATNESLKRIMNPRNEHNLFAFFASGAGAGAMAAAVTNPLDVAKTRLQTQSICRLPGCDMYGRPVDACDGTGSKGSSAVKRSGAQRGFASLASHATSQLFQRHALRVESSRSSSQGHGPSTHGHGLSTRGGVDAGTKRAVMTAVVGGESSGASAVAALGSVKPPREYTGLVDAMQRIYVEEGLRGFARGLRPRLVQHIPAVAISWTAYEQAKRVLLRNFDE